MAHGHISRKDLKHDALSDMGRSAFEYILSHRTRILTIIVAALALIVAIKMGQMAVHARRANAASMLVQAQRQIRDASQLTETIQRDGMLAAAIERCNDLRRRYPNTRAGIEALYVKGNALYQRGDYDLAIAEYQSYIGRSRDNLDKAKGNLAIGYALEDKAFLAAGDPEMLRSAQEYFAEAERLGTDADGAPSYLAAEAMLGRARILRQQGDIAAARALYETVAAERLFLEPEPDTPARFRSDDPDLLAREEMLERMRRQIRDMKMQFSYQSIALNALEEIEAIAEAPATPE